MKTPLLYSLLTASIFGIASQAFAIDMLFQSDVDGDGENTVNVTGKNNGNDGNGILEVLNPIYTSWNNAANVTTGGSFGGGSALNGLTFSMVVTDFEGNSGAGDAIMNGDGAGMGIITNGSGRQWEIDGQESFSMTGSQDYDFEGFKSRGGYSFADGQNRQIAFSSASWGGLNSIDGANDLGDGVSFSISGGIGTFVIGGTGIDNYKDTFALADILGTHASSIALSVNAGDSLTIDNHLDGYESDGGNGFTGIALDYMSISTVPEPSTFALLAGCFGLTAVMLRRRG